MLNTITSLTASLTTISSVAIDNKTFTMCSAVSLLLGLLISFTFCFRQKKSKGFILALTILPLIVQVIIMMVNGNVGTGVAVMGAFSLVRFRSVPGNAKEICGIFLAMAVGLATGTDQLVLAAVFTTIACAVALVFTFTPIGNIKENEKTLTVTIPESLDYTEIFDDIFEKYLSACELENVKTTAMGSLYKLKYSVTLKDSKNVKKMLDEIRERNGNLEVMCGKKETPEEQL